MRIGLSLLLTTVIAMAVTANVAAQESWHAAVAAGAIYSTQPSGTIPGSGDPNVPRPPIGGAAPGFLLNGELAITRMVGVGVEVSNAGYFDAIQTTGGSSGRSQIEDRHRDLIVSGLVSFHHQIASRIRLRAAGGMSYVQEQTLMRAASAPPLSNAPLGPYGPETSLTRNTVGATGGLDLGVQIAPHISVGPTVRAHFISRAVLGHDPDTLSGSLGLSPFVLRLGVNLRVSF